MLPLIDNYTRIELNALARSVNLKKYSSLGTKALYNKLVSLGVIFDPNQNVHLMTVAQMKAYAHRCHIDVPKTACSKINLLEILQQNNAVFSDQVYENRRIDEATEVIREIFSHTVFHIKDLARIVASYLSSIPCDLVSKRQTPNIRNILIWSCTLSDTGRLEYKPNTHFELTQDDWNDLKTNVISIYFELTQDDWNDLKTNVISIYFMTTCEKQAKSISRYNRWVFCRTLSKAYGPNNKEALLFKLSDGWIFGIIQDKKGVALYRGKLLSDLIKQFTPSFLTISETS